MLIHIISDIALSVSLFFFPQHFIEFSGWKTFDPFALRLVAAGLSAVAIQLFLQRNNLVVYKTVINIKLSTIGVAALGTIIVMISNNQPPIIAEWILLIGTIIPFLQIAYWNSKLSCE